MTEHSNDPEAIFLAALDKATPQERAAYVAGACVGNAELLRRVRELLGCHDASRGPLDAPPAGFAATADEPVREAPGTVIGPYKLLQQIGEGGMGTVFMAEQTHPVRRKVALKLIKPGMDTQQVIARFEAERQALAMMDHVNIARVLDAGATESGRPFFVMELVHGVPITKYCDDNHLTPRQRLELFVPVCQAIQHAHTKGIIHRDVKPSNILVTLYDGEPVPKVIDFGVAKATEQPLTQRTMFTQFGTIVGTLEYMSPEQAEMSGLGVDTRGDIYSLGVLLYELLTGSTPLERPRLRQAAYDEALRLIREEEAPRPSARLSSSDTLPAIAAARKTEPAKLAKLVRGELDWIVLKALEKDRTRRYETASGFAADVRHYLDDEPVQACPPSGWYRFRKLARRHRVALSTAALVLAALVVGTCASTWQAVRARRAEVLGETRLQAEAEQRRRADAERARAVAAGNLAEERLQLATDAVGKYLQDVTEDEDLKSADFNKLRKRLLQSAVPFFQKFVEQNSGEAELEAARGKAYHRLALLRREMGELDAAVADFEQTRAIFTKLDADFPNMPEHRRELARSHHNLGALFAVLGRNGQAEGEFRAALTIQETLAAGLANVPEYRVQLANSHSSLGNLLTDLGRRSEAEGEYRVALSIYEKLAAEFRTVPDHHSALANIHNNLGGLLAELGQRDEAEGEHRVALTIREKLAADVPAVPTYRRDLATSHDNLGLLLARLGRRDEAEGAYRVALAIKEKLAADFATVPEYRGELATSHSHLGLLLAELGQYGDAEGAFRVALTIQEKLAADLPTVPKYRHDLAMCLLNLGSLLRSIGKAGEAEGAYRRALTIYEKLTADHPDALEFQVALGGSCCNLGTLVLDGGDAGAALAWFARAAQTLQGAADRDDRHSTTRLFLRNAHWNRAIALEALGRYGEAADDWRRAAELDEGPMQTALRRAHAEALARAGNHASAAAEATRLAAFEQVPGDTLYNLACVLSLCASAVKDGGALADQYAVRAVELLTLAKGQGFFKDARNVEHMNRDTDLDTLRARADFGQLIAGLDGETKE